MLLGKVTVIGEEEPVPIMVFPLERSITSKEPLALPAVKLTSKLKSVPAQLPAVVVVPVIRQSNEKFSSNPIITG